MQKTTKILNFYPGSFWLKRMFFLLTLFTITPNLFLDDVQDLLIEKGEELLEVSNTMYTSAEMYADGAVNFAIPMLQWIEAYDQEASQPRYNWWTDSYGPGFQIKPFIEGMVRKSFSQPFSMPHSTEIEADVEMVRSFGDQIREFVPFFRGAAVVIQWTSIAIWFPILAASVPWLFLHLTYGEKKERRFTLGMLYVAVFFNAMIYAILHDNFRAYVQEILNNTIIS